MQKKKKEKDKGKIMEYLYKVKGINRVKKGKEGVPLIAFLYERKTLSDIFNLNAFV